MLEYGVWVIRALLFFSYSFHVACYAIDDMKIVLRFLSQEYALLSTTSDMIAVLFDGLLRYRGERRGRLVGV